MVSRPFSLGYSVSLVGPEVSAPLDEVSQLAEVNGISWWFSSPEEVLDLPDLARMFAPIGNGSCKIRQASISSAALMFDSTTLRATSTLLREQIHSTCAR
jgi:hypothetical protein